MRVIEAVYDWLATPVFLGWQRFEWIINALSFIMVAVFEALMVLAIIGIIDGNVY